jgi:hypothetical protein
MAKKKAVRDVKGPAEKKPSDSGQIEVDEGNIGRLTVRMLSSIVFQLKRIADVMENKKDG